MPTILSIQGYRIGFFSADHDEPPHVHVTKGGNAAKFWLDPVQLATNIGYRRHELNEIVRLLEQNHQRLMEAWNEYFG